VGGRLDAEVRGPVKAGTLSKEHLLRCFDWKMQRGADRTNLLGKKMKALTDKDVRTAYHTAFSLLTKMPEGAVPPADDHRKLVRSVVNGPFKPLSGASPGPPRVVSSTAAERSLNVIRVAHTQGWGRRWRPWC
jgi:hypothetical protein